MQMMDEYTALKSRLVHLDLKGAHPSLDYLEKFLPLLKQWGATGLLVEYEDVFPYDGHLKALSCPEAYSKDDVLKLMQLAKTNEISVIPLVQTFGHMEFVLKHSQFSHLREVDKLSMAICPCKEESLSLVCAILDQVMLLHSGIEYFHIGCDEVYHLGLCDLCVSTMISNNWNKGRLFFSLVKKVATYLREKYPQMTCIVWDDMFRYLELSIIEGCELGHLVEPMVWHYLPVFSLPNDLWSKLSAVFSNVWIASAFKGATGPRATVPNIKYHLDNHNSWQQLLPHISQQFKSIKGIAFTGWQRYDHYAIFCEFLPTAIPSLALCMKFMDEKNLNEFHIKQVSKELGFESPIPITHLPATIIGGEFPGRDLFELMNEFYQWEIRWKEFITSDYLETWMNDYNVARKFINPVHAQLLLSQALQLISTVNNIESRSELSFQEVFHSSNSVVQEWLSSFLLPKKRKLEKFVKKVRDVIPE